MNCECGTLLRNTKKGYVEDGVIHRNVTCDKNRGGCGNTFWYTKKMPSPTMPVMENGDLCEIANKNITLIKRQVKHPFTKIYPPSNVTKLQEIDLDGIR